MHAGLPDRVRRCVDRRRPARLAIGATTLWIVDHASVGVSRVDVGAPGGDYLQATDTVQVGTLAALTNTGATW